MAPDHVMLARIVALLLGLATLAERAASEPPATRLRLLWILLPALRAALTLLPAGHIDPASPQVPSHIDDQASESLLRQLAVSLRLIAALVFYAGLNERGAPPRAIALSRALPLRHSGRRFMGQAGIAHDTS